MTSLAPLTLALFTPSLTARRDKRLGCETVKGWPAVEEEEVEADKKGRGGKQKKRKPAKAQSTDIEE